MKHSIFLLVLGIVVWGPLSAQRTPNRPTAAGQVPAATGTVGVNTVQSIVNPYPGTELLTQTTTWQPKQPFSTESSVSASSNTVLQVQKVIRFTDGLGRPVQVVSWQASPTGNDIVLPIYYTSTGTDEYKYLPYADNTGTGQFQYTAFADQQNFYNSTYPASEPAMQGEKYYYEHLDYEKSPLKRVTADYAPGNSWAGSEGGTTPAGKLIQYSVNTTADQVYVWNIAPAYTLAYSFSDVGAFTPQASTTYAQGTLTKTITTDENGNQVVQFYDTNQKLVLQKQQTGAVSSSAPYQNWSCTYYVYDDIGNLYCTITPKAVAQMVAGSSWSLTSVMISDLCFWYVYDVRGRTIAEKAPGAGWSYIIYDTRDRPVFTQDPNQGNLNEWRFTLYDNQDRPAETGMMQYAATPATLQGLVNNLTSSLTTVINTVNTTAQVPPTLVVSQPDPTRSVYTATGSVVCEPGFSITAPANGTAVNIQITADPTITTSTSTQTINYSPLSISGASYTPLTMSYYDNYNQSSSAVGFTAAYNSNLTGGSNPAATLVAQPGAYSPQIQGMVTGGKVIALENPATFAGLSTGNWMETAKYYDSKGRTIESVSENYKGGIDTYLAGYNFSGDVVYTYLNHNNPLGNISNFGELTSNNYDAGGRLTSVTKMLNGNTATLRTILTNKYDALGRLQNREIGEQTSLPTTAGAFPSPTPGTFLENENYAYNIRGWLKGINWNYPSSGPTTSQVNTQNTANYQWVGEDLGYDYGYANGSTAANQFNGDLSGMKWMSGGDLSERVYAYAYDPSNRLLNADFAQNFGSGTTENWLNTDPNNSKFQIDYSVAVGSSSIPAYDANGNIGYLQQNGMYNNGTAFVSNSIDQITYQYTQTNSTNVLLSATDANSTNTLQYNLGNFIDNNSGNNDYLYDGNGNLTQDLNKRITLTYNFLNQPYQIAFTNANGSAKGTLTYIYDAVGNKLETRVNELPSSTNNNATILTTVSYVSGFQYKNNVLQFLSQELGQIRPQRDPYGNLLGYDYDYFLKDHLGNIRSIVTDQQQQDIYPAATLEGGATGLTSSSSAVYVENSYYTINGGDIFPSNEVTGITSYWNKNGGDAAADPPVNPNPNSNVTATSQYVYELSGAAGSTTQTGLGITLRVMAGDQVSVFGKSYYNLNALSQPYNPLPVATIIASMLGTPQGASITAGDGITSTMINANSEATGPIALLQAAQATATSNSTTSTFAPPRAYINYILFDNNFNVKGYGTDPVGSEGVVKDYSSDAVLQNIPIKFSGYIYVYCSNESQVPVYFDNLQVVANHGPLVEENQYYPAGLMMAGISSRALNFGGVPNYLKYQGKELQDGEFSDGSGLKAHDFNARFYDHQLGVWHNQDPDQQFSSPYLAMANNWPQNIDPTGRGSSFLNIALEVVVTAALAYFGLDIFGTSGQILGDVGIASNSVAATAIYGGLLGAAKAGALDIKNQLFSGQSYGLSNYFEAIGLGALEGSITKSGGYGLLDGGEQWQNILYSVIKETGGAVVSNVEKNQNMFYNLPVPLGPVEVNFSGGRPCLELNEYNLLSAGMFLNAVTAPGDFSNIGLTNTLNFASPSVNGNSGILDNLDGWLRSWNLSGGNIFGHDLGGLLDLAAKQGGLALTDAMIDQEYYPMYSTSVLLSFMNALP
ncbi:DUF6443 domain-containing protein [Dinghuibacter silviterrae]|nr:DUF6443 domain-containing protein [Dinghuibacter silviterrae]